MNVIYKIINSKYQFHPLLIMFTDTWQFQFKNSNVTKLYKNKNKTNYKYSIVQSTGAVEYTNYISAEV